MSGAGCPSTHALFGGGPSPVELMGHGRGRECERERKMEGDTGEGRRKEKLRSDCLKQADVYTLGKRQIHFSVDTGVIATTVSRLVDGITELVGDCCSKNERRRALARAASRPIMLILEAFLFLAVSGRAGCRIF